MALFYGCANDEPYRSEELLDFEEIELDEWEVFSSMTKSAFSSSL